MPARYLYKLHLTIAMSRANDSCAMIDLASMIHVNFSTSPLSYIFSSDARSADNPGPGVDQVDDAVTVQRDVLLRDDLDRLLRDEPTKERCHVREVCRWGARSKGSFS